MAASVPPPPQKFDVAKALWVFISGSSEARHLYDIIFGVDVLRGRGVPDANVAVFSDHPQPAVELSPYGIKNVYRIETLSAELSKRGGFELVVVVATGHGNDDGIPISGHPPLTPVALQKAVSSCPGVKVGVIVLGQCYAGIFNYLDVSGSPSLCIIGATNLTPSLSRDTKLVSPILRADKSPGLQQWTANVFLSGFFYWLNKPRDVDGDGRMALTDAYKHAGLFAHKDNMSSRPYQHLAAENERQKLVNFMLQLQAIPQPSPMLQLQLMTKAGELERLLETMFVHQEPWVLNARLAASIEL